MIKNFIARNKIRNAHLYMDDLVEGYDYVTCPISNIRCSMIKSTHIVKNLKMSVEEFDERFPNFQKICSKRKENIASGLKQLGDDGLTVHRRAMDKATLKRREVGPDGLTSNQRIGINTRKTHMKNIDQNGLNGYQRIAKGRNETILASGISVQQAACKKGNYTKSKNNNTTRGASKKSLEELKPILDWLSAKNMYHYFDDNEYTIYDEGKAYRFDLVIPDYCLAIEFHGEKWHPDVNYSQEEWDEWRQLFSGKTANEVRAYDLKKQECLMNIRGFKTIEIYERRADIEVESLLEFLQRGCNNE